MVEPDRAGVTETHISVVFFVGDRVYKLKKPVRLDFVDLSTVARRAAICRREVELNRRLAPDVYLGTYEIRDDRGEVVDHLVVMRRMPADRRLSGLVASGADVADDVRAIAREVATFHSRAERSTAIDAAATVDAVRTNWTDNVATMAPFVGSVLDPTTAERVATRAVRFLAGRAPLLDARIAEHRIVDGHGDLMADDIFCLADGPRILDCIEFADGLRHGDVLADVAFLAMDLERLGAPELARRFLAWYSEFSGATFPTSLAHFYVAYRAHVRSKVACLRAAQGDPDAAAQAAHLLDLADSHLARGRVRLVLVGGAPGTGKSTLAAGLADRGELALLRSDEVRKDLDGSGHTERRDDAFGAGRYTPARTDATYAALLERARTLLSLGESVVLDASWTDARHRSLARDLAGTTHSDLTELRCTVAPTIAAARIAGRAAAGTDPSDATPAIASRLAAAAAPWPEAVEIATDDEPAAVTAAALRHV